MTAGFSPDDGRPGRLAASVTFRPRPTVSAEVPVMIGSTRTEMTLPAMRRRSPSTRTACASASPICWATRRPRDRGLSPGEPECDAVGHLFPDRQRLPLRRADDEDRRAAGGAREGARSTCTTSAGRHRSTAAASSRRTRWRFRSPSTTSRSPRGADRRRSGGDGARGQDQQRVDRLRPNRRPEHAQAAALAGVQPDRSTDDGLQQRQRGGERSASPTAADDVQRDELELTVSSLTLEDCGPCILVRRPA